MNQLNEQLSTSVTPVEVTEASDSSQIIEVPLFDANRLKAEQKSVEVSDELEDLLINNGDSAGQLAMEHLAFSDQDEIDLQASQQSSFLSSGFQDQETSIQNNDEATNLKNRRVYEVSQNQQMVDFLENNPAMKNLAFAIREMTYAQVAELLGMQQRVKEEQKDNKMGVLEIIIRFMFLTLQLMASGFEEIKDREEIFNSAKSNLKNTS